MNQAHLHLVFNHLPIIIPIVGLLVLIGGLVVRSEIVQRTAYLLFVLGALSTIPAFQTGEGAEEIVEEMPGINEESIKIHEEAAETFSLFSYGLGAVSLLGVWANWKKKSFSRMISIVTLAVCLVTLFFAQQTGNTGGVIRHPEITNKN
ncbi:hypothetical protein P872_19625 [Rhodonellum psychrophilum GCM71 = DSM 17998]|uniref:DUF2231 domain-containing protein n=2 Tax=Rhodonellum TaxID=336827 RepID=U5BVX3_9BACT|nr:MULTISPECIES: hypothetical protein [Rhodonellum]ERM81709.1 hypothetical protein P872_19625 [Rhodonellum psychrophilum GCM71 = DSM 17998]MDO9554782.1 hypothetical protein [Rhodonellum sp.]SDY83745.1 hypothetical protein SAMN05444412_10391 [Rhodonellum ikkaensis]